MPPFIIIIINIILRLTVYPFFSTKLNRVFLIINLDGWIDDIGGGGGGVRVASLYRGCIEIRYK